MSLSSDIASGTTFFLGTTTVTYTATDASGNTSSTTFNVIVVDSEDPTISGTPADITQSADPDLCSTVVAWVQPTAADNCPGVSLSSDIAPGATFGLGTTVVTFTATDASGNTTTSTFQVTITDDEAPSISGMPANITQTNDAGNCSAAVTWTAPTAADNCAVNTFTSDAAPGDTFPVGTTTVTYTATDGSGNTTTASFNVTVTDDEAPSISGMPANITQTNDAGNCSAAVTWTEPCLLYTSPSPRDGLLSRMPSSA